MKEKFGTCEKGTGLYELGPGPFQRDPAPIHKFVNLLRKREDLR